MQGKGKQFNKPRVNFFSKEKSSTGWDSNLYKGPLIPLFTYFYGIGMCTAKTFSGLMCGCSISPVEILKALSSAEIIIK